MSSNDEQMRSALSRFYSIHIGFVDFVHSGSATQLRKTHATMLNVNAAPFNSPGMKQPQPQGDVINWQSPATGKRRRSIQPLHAPEFPATGSPAPKGKEPSGVKVSLQVSPPKPH